MSMSYNQAADEVRKILKGFRAVEQVSEALEKVGSLENATKEAEKRLDSLNAQGTAATCALKATEEEVQAAKDEAKKIKAKAKEQADAILGKAQDQATTLVADAILAVDAKTKSVASAQAELTVITAAIAGASAELEAIEKKIAAAKKQVATILG